MLSYSNDLLVFAGGIPEDLATNPTITLARAREPDELEVTSPICTPSPDCNGDSSPLIERDIEIMREKDTNKLQGQFFMIPQRISYTINICNILFTISKLP